MTRKQSLLLGTVAVLGVASVWAARAVHRARYDLVTLHVADVPLARVLSRISWQTRERVTADSRLDSRVSLDVAGAPLSEVLDDLARQLGAFRRTTYAVHASPSALNRLVGLIGQGEDPTRGGWTNLTAGDVPGAGTPPGSDLVHGEGRFHSAAAAEGSGLSRGLERAAGVDVRITREPPARGGSPGISGGRPTDGGVQERRRVTRVTLDENGRRLEVDLSPERLLLEDTLIPRFKPADDLVANDTVAARVAAETGARWTKLYALEALPVPSGGLPPMLPPLNPEHRTVLSDGTPAPFEGGPTEASLLRHRYDQLTRLTPEQRARQAAQEGPTKIRIETEDSHP